MSAKTTSHDNKKLLKDLENTLQELKAIHSSRAEMLTNIHDKKKEAKEKAVEILNK